MAAAPPLSSSSSASALPQETLVYTWHLPETVVRLFNDHGKVKTRAINPKTGHEVETPIRIGADPKVDYLGILTTQSAPQLGDDGNITLKPITKNIVIEWFLEKAGGKVVRQVCLINRSNNYSWNYSDARTKTSYQIPFDHVFVYNEGRKEYHERYFQINLTLFNLFANPSNEAYLPLFFFKPERFSIERTLSYFKDCEPVKEKIQVVANKTLLLHVSKTLVKSRISKEEVIVDRAFCGVTLADTGRPVFLDPTTYAGHAALFVEGLDEKGEYFMTKCHLVSTEDGNHCEVKLIPNFDIQRQHIDHQTQTWIVPRENVERMLRGIEWQIRCQKGVGLKRADYSRPGTRWGSATILETFKTKAEAIDYCKKNDGEGLERYEVKENSSKTFDVIRTPQNCMDWAEANLELLGIHLPRDDRWISYLMNLPKVRF